jgi:hypothetical protein
MSMNFRSQNALTTAKVETTIGTDAAPTAGSNAIRGEPADWSPAFDTEQTNFARGSISMSAPIINGGSAKVQIKTALMGSAAAGTTAPDIGVYFRGCAMSQTLLAADVTGTAQAGAAGTMTLAAGASAVDNFYRGLVIETTGGTGGAPVQRRVITGYVGSTKVASIYPNWTVTTDATTTYAIRKGALYQPITVAQEALTIYSYLRNSAAAGLARLRKVTGAMGGYSIAISAKKIARVTFSFQGIFPGAPTDVSDPGVGTFAGVDPRPYINAQTFLGGVAVKFNDFTMDSGNKPSNFADPAAAYGNDSTEIIDRTGTGKITPALSMIATMDAITDWVNSTSKPLWLCWGAVGSGVSIYIPALRYTGNEPADADGFAVEGLPFQLTGDDLEVIINFF